MIDPSVRLAIAAVAGVAACVYPTERGDQLQVEFDAIPPLIEGEVFQLTARVMTASGAAIPNAVVTYSSSDPLIALVTPDGGLLATGVGNVDITAAALGVDAAQIGTQSVRIHGVLEIDSVVPATRRYGELASIHGSGLTPDSLFAVLLGGSEAVVEDYTPLLPDEPSRFGVLRVWVKHPAPTQALAQVLGFNGLATSPDTLRVLRWDVYEPNDTLPWDFGPATGLVGNPALAFERRPRDDSIGVDWYRFTQTTTGDRTFVVRSDQVGPESYQVYVTNGIQWQGLATGFAFGSTAWVVGTTLHMCQGIPFAPPQFPDDSVVVALQDLPPGQYDLFTVYERPAAYGMGIIESYRSQLAPDAAEENDYCDVAAPIVIGTNQSYTIDNPHDRDWYAVTLTDTTNLTVDVVADNPEADLDVYLLRNFLPDSLQGLAVGQTDGTADAFGARVPPGDYFVVVIDFRGVPTTYTFRGASVATLPDHTGLTAPLMTLSRHGHQGGFPLRAVPKAGFRVPR